MVSRHYTYSGGEIVKEKIKYIIGIVILLIVVLIFLLCITHKDKLPIIKEDDVITITLDGVFDEKYEVRNLDANEFIKYYNQINSIVENTEDEGGTSTSNIVIELKSGTVIYIGNVGDDFEISYKTINGKVKQYFAKQHNIRNLLYYGKY